MNLNTRAGEIAILAALTVFFGGIAVALVLTHHDSGSAANVLIDALTGSLTALIALTRGNSTGDPTPPQPQAADKPKP